LRTTLLWFRRDLRIGDHPALCAAHAAGDVLPVYVLDPALLASGGVRTQRLVTSLSALREATGGALVVRHGDPTEMIAQLARQADAAEVHVTAETTPYGRRRDARVATRLAADGRRLVATGTPYAVDPGSVLTGGGTPYQVFTPFSRSWRDHGWPAPAAVPEGLPWRRSAGETDALERWQQFLDQDLEGYADGRDRPDLDSTSRMSVHLKYGEIHPRTMLADLAGHPAAAGAGAARFVAELCWREFYADLLWHRPHSAWQDLRGDLGSMAYDSGAGAERLVTAWREGRTGYPLVDAGMRQLLAEGWMHNRVRMVTASFLAKDLHVWWPVGARHFLDHLHDGDLASNSHGWQWVAGTGSDASPYFRVFHPVTQARRFDPEGDYVRRWVPELRHLTGADVHEPWRSRQGYDHGYPEPIVDHARERREAMDRYRQAREDR
jgi:deoxyribodipyrimidine photo-lyase